MRLLRFEPRPEISTTILKSIEIKIESNLENRIESSEEPMLLIIRRSIYLLSLSLLLICSISLADGGNREDWAAPQNKEVSKSSVNDGSDASFDKRLPPVFPGEEVRDNGKKIKVWSTSGPVPVSPPPQPFDTYNGRQLPSGTGVIVDRRREDTNSSASRSLPANSDISPQRTESSER